MKKPVSISELVKTYSSLIDDLKGKINEKEFNKIKRSFDSHNKKFAPKPKPKPKPRVVRSKYILLDNITESSDKKSLVFNFKNNNSFTYNLINKKFELEGSLGKVEFLENQYLLTERQAKISRNQSIVNDQLDLFINSSQELWIKTFFSICRQENINIFYRPSKSVLAVLNRIEIISKIEKFQNIKDFSKITHLINCNKFKTSLKDLEVDSWFIDAALNNGELWQHIYEYNYAKKENLISEFQFLWNNYENTEIRHLYQRTRDLTKNCGYDFGTLIKYLNEEMHYQGITPLFYDNNNYYHIDYNDCHYSGLDLLKQYVECQTDDNYEKYPRNLKTELDKSYYRMQIVENQRLNEKSKVNFEKLKAFEFEDENYCVIAPQSIKDIVSEGNALCHCIANYAKSTAEGNYKVVFMRRISDKNAPLLTISLSGKKNIQAHYVRGKNNREVDSQEFKFVKKYNEYLKSQCALLNENAKASLS